MEALKDVAVSYLNYVAEGISGTAKEIIVAKTPGIDFGTLTTIDKLWFQRWIFPKNFTDSLTEEVCQSDSLEIACCVRLVSSTREDLVRAERVVNPDPFSPKSLLESDSIFHIQRVYQDASFFLESANGKRSTIIHADPLGKTCSITILRGSKQLRFEGKLEKFSFTMEGLINKFF